ncbi:MAG TPA: HYR domain-containing protein, partial [Thermoanaerobaculia bacterium]|nr:HYR domain-containing protein [Thermoanaerobaculia bacterium]
MRNTAVAVLVFLVALSAAAKIESVEPREFVANSGEQFININGTELGDTVVFSGGKAGELKLEVSAKTERGVIAYVPDEIIANEGRYTLSMGSAGSATFDVVVPKPADPLVLQVPDPVTAPATGRDGARVSFTVWPLGGGDPRPIVTCDHASGDLFPIGYTIVKCTASNSLGEHASGEVFVTIYDGTPPTLVVPHKIVVPAESREGAFVKWEATASDFIDGTVPVSCDPKSGSLFPIGITTVTCTATDSALNVGVATFTVEVFEGK